MKFNSTPRLQCPGVLIFLLLVAFKIGAQNVNEDAGAYITTIGNAEKDMSKTYLSYMSAVAHSGKTGKVEKMRQQTLESIQNSKFKISELPYYKGDNSLRKSSMEYMDMCYKVFNEDYAHIVDMEEIAEQSFDEMQFYILTQEKTNEKLKTAYEKVQEAQKVFAAKYNVNLIESKDELWKNMEIISEVNHYRNQLYLVFFKCNWQDDQITEAINAKKITGIEASRNALASYAKEGLLALDSLNNFNGDPSLAQACKKALQFYQKLAENDLPKVTEFFLQEENFNKIKQATDLKPRHSLTKQDVDAYNKAVKEYNAATKAYKQVNDNTNAARKQVIDNWNNANLQFMDTHIPHVDY